MLYDKSKLKNIIQKKNYINSKISPPDLAICLDPRDEAVNIAFLSGAKFRASYYLPDKPISVFKGMLRLTHRYRHPSVMGKNNNLSHEVEVDINLLKLLGMGDNPDHHVKLYLTDEEKKEASRLLKKYNVKNERLVLLHLPLKWCGNGWDKEYIIELANGILSALPNSRLILTCGPEEETLMNCVIPSLPKNIITFSGLDVRIWAAIFSYCRLVITRDCGAVHIAGAMGVPVVSVFEESKRIEHKRWEAWETKHVNIFRPETLPPYGFIEHINDIIEGCKKLLEEPS